MKIFSLNNSSLLEVKEAVLKIIRHGGIVAVPTDTVYGLIGDASSKKAIAKLFAIKNRPKEKAFPVFVSNIAMARRYAYISDVKARFLEKVWPGAVTVIFHHKEKLPPILTGNLDTVALRMPNSPFLEELMKNLDFPLCQSSANISGNVPAETSQEIVCAFEASNHKPDAVVDGGVIDGSSSLLIDYTKNNPMILRSGIMTINELNLLLDQAAEV